MVYLYVKAASTLITTKFSAVTKGVTFVHFVVS